MKGQQEDSECKEFKAFIRQSIGVKCLYQHMVRMHMHTRTHDTTVASCIPSIISTDGKGLSRHIIPYMGICNCNTYMYIHVQKNSKNKLERQWLAASQVDYLHVCVVQLGTLPCCTLY